MGCALRRAAAASGRWKPFRPSSLPTHVAAEAREFTGDIENFGPLEKEQKKAIRKGLKVMCRECQMGVAAAQLALSDAGLVVGGGTYDPERTGCVFGADYMLTMPEEFSAGINRCRDAEGTFDYNRWATDGMPQLSPLWLLKYLPNMPASHVAIYNDLRGPNNSITHREAAANLAIGEAYRTILRGSADIDGRRRHRHARASDENRPRHPDRRTGRQRRGTLEGQPAVRQKSHRHGHRRRGRRDRDRRTRHRQSPRRNDLRRNRRARLVARRRYQLRGPPRCGPGQRHA